MGRRLRLVALAAAVAVAVLTLRGVALEPYRVASASMAPTVGQGDVVLVDKLTPRWSGVRAGDLVVFRSPQDGDDALKRVVAVGGQRVAIRDAVLHVDDRVVVEPQVDRSRVDGLWFGPVTVARGAVFVLGDARAGSIDSRVYGDVPLGEVRGRVLLRAWPPG